MKFIMPNFAAIGQMVFDTIGIGREIHLTLGPRLPPFKLFRSSKVIRFDQLVMHMGLLFHFR